jgi:TonB family protein
MKESLSTGTSRIGLILNSQPPKRTKMVYQAIILALSLHIFVYCIAYLITASPAGENAAEKPALEEFELTFAPQDEEAEMEGQGSKMVQNLLANAESQRTDQAVNYSAKSQAQIDAEVQNELSNFEKNEFEGLKSGRKDAPTDVPEKTKKVPSEKDQKDEYDWYRNQDQKSYQGPVSAEYNLPGRSVRSSPRPTYRCKSSGSVVVNIKVDSQGAVTDAAVNEGKTNGNECIRSESVNYALKWKFDSKDIKKQDGTITFTFSQQ